MGDRLDVERRARHVSGTRHVECPSVTVRGAERRDHMAMPEGGELGGVIGIGLEQHELRARKHLRSKARLAPTTGADVVDHAGRKAERLQPAERVAVESFSALAWSQETPTADAPALAAAAR
jgi:hypothetical protein